MKVYFYLTGYYVLSNYSAHAIEFEGKLYPTVEHAFQSAKFSDPAIVEEIITAKSPNIAKNLANTKFADAKREDWPEVKLGIMERLLREKAQQHEDVQEALINSGTNEIIEQSPDDYFWGCGKDETGQNHLGNLWVKIRQDYRN